MRKVILVGTLLLCAAPVLAQDHTDLVRAVKADLVARGVNIAGPCGAFQITGRVAYLLRDEGWGLLAKSPAQNGCTINGARYAVDVVVRRPSGQGVDMLINAETQNIPAWQLFPLPAVPDFTQWRAPFQMDPTPPSSQRRVKMDFDGDGRADIGVYRPSQGTAYISGLSRSATYTGGLSTDIPVAGDYDGDRKSDPAIFRAGTGEWLVGLSSTGAGIVSTFGADGDIPVPGDYNGDGKTDIGIFRPATGNWFLQTGTYTFGASGDVPIPGDYNGDGKTDIGVFRPSTGEWFLGTGAVYTFGASGDIPAPGDYNGDGKTDIAVYRPSTGTWYLGTGVIYTWGGGGDIPVPGDYDGDGKTDIAVFRPSTGAWYIIESRTSIGAIYTWGGDGDIPILERP
jgi:hypothetical protein